MEVQVSTLWLPIVVSALLVLLASALVWTVLPHHRNDWRSAPNGERVQELMIGAPPGQYVYPRRLEPAERKDLEAQKRYAQSSGFIIVKEPGLSMGKPLALSMLYYLIISLFAAYLGSLVLRAGAPFLEVFRVTGTAALLGYCGGLLPRSIWWGYRWGATLKEVLDGVVYGFLTAGVFALLWP